MMGVGKGTGHGVCGGWVRGLGECDRRPESDSPLKENVRISGKMCKSDQTASCAVPDLDIY